MLLKPETHTPPSNSLYLIVDTNGGHSGTECKIKFHFKTFVGLKHKAQPTAHYLVSGCLTRVVPSS
jgi:hypothetical protein